MTVYEYPFTEGMRTLLRLERLLDRLGELLARRNALDHHFALATLFEVLDVAARADLKTELLQELDRQRLALCAFRGNPAIAEDVLEATLGRVDTTRQGLLATTGKVGRELTEHEWLMSVRSRITIPGGTCEFDLPAYHAWLQGDAEQRLTDLQGWVTTLAPLAGALRLALELLRGAGVVHALTVRGGTSQLKLAPGRAVLLARLRVDPAAGWAPEMSGHRLQFGLRLVRTTADGKLQTVPIDTDLPLTLCA